MDMQSSLVFIHVLLFVFWLGTDIGVFLAGKISERGELGVETRATVMKLGMVLDRLPRSALTLIVPTGLQMAANTGLLVLPDLVVPIVWLVCLVWLVILWTGFLRPETVTEERSTKFNFLMHVVMAVVVNAYAVYLLTSGGAPAWLATKILMVGLIFIAGLLLDVMFKPAVAAFVVIVTQGGTPERDAAYSQAIRPVYKAVLAIYLFVIIAAYMGVTKPGF